MYNKSKNRNIAPIIYIKPCILTLTYSHNLAILTRVLQLFFLVPTAKKRGRKKGGKNKPNNDKNSTKIEDSGRLKKVQIQYLKNEFSEDSNKISNTRAEEIAIQISSNAEKVKRWWATNQKSGYKSKPNKWKQILKSKIAK